MNEQSNALVEQVAKVWKDGGGDAMGFYWCQDAIRAAILLLEQTPLENYIGSLGADQPSGDA